MKKIYTDRLFKKRNKTRSHNRSKRKYIFKEYKKIKNKKKLGKSKKQVRLDNLLNINPYRSIIAPTDISFKEYTDEFVNFINEINYHVKYGISTHIDFSNTYHIDQTSIIAITAASIQIVGKKINLRISKPSDNKVNNLLRLMGFYDKLQDKYKELNKKKIYFDNNIETHYQRKVNEELAEKIVFDSAKVVWGEERRCPGIYRVLIELMLNTHNHANHRGAGEQHWWLSIIDDSKNNVVKFSFIDFGLGVIKNLDSKKPGEKFHGWRQLLQGKLLSKIETPVGLNYFLFGFTLKAFEPEYLRFLINGMLHKEEKQRVLANLGRSRQTKSSTMKQSSTNLYYRGKGLPSMKDALTRNHIKNLFIITNNVKADVANDDFSYINGDFSGSFYYWELDKTCRNFPKNFVENHE